MQGSVEEWTELYMKYSEGIPETLTQQSAKSKRR
jgi:hypothetical protein